MRTSWRSFFLSWMMAFLKVSNKLCIKSCLSASTVMAIFVTKRNTKMSRIIRCYKHHVSNLSSQDQQYYCDKWDKQRYKIWEKINKNIKQPWRKIVFFQAEEQRIQEKRWDNFVNEKKIYLLKQKITIWTNNQLNEEKPCIQN